MAVILAFVPRLTAFIPAFIVLAGGIASAEDQESTPATTMPVPALLESLDLCREGILDEEARPVERRRWTLQLFSYDAPEAKALSVQLLGMSDRPEVQQALCEVIVERARQGIDPIGAGLIDPLLELLGAETKNLRMTAAEALAGLPGPDVPEKLGALAGHSEAPMPRRLAAIDALALNIHRRDVVAQLVGLLDSSVAEITERVMAALEPASRETIGPDPARWKQWWAVKSKLGNEAWLADQVQMYRARLRSAIDKLDTCRRDTAQRQSALTERLQTFQRDIFRGLGDGQKRAALTEWLGGSLAEVKLTALDLIKSRIADEGLRPEGDLLEALLDLLRHGSPSVRREVLLIVQNLSDPAVIEAVLDLLEVERDPATRYAVFTAIGKLDRPEAVPALVREIADSASPPDCVRKAAIALGKIAPRANVSEHVPDAAAGLKARYATLREDDVPLRAALLDAMAGVGDDSFASEFLQAVESDDANVVRPAIHGLLAIDDRSRLPRLRDLTDHPDPRVRLAAIKALGGLGSEDADLESLLPRLDPANENNEAAQAAAWQAVNSLLGKQNKPLADRIKASKRLRDTPAYEIEYLEGLAGELSAANGHSTELETIRERLGAIHITQGNYVQATLQLRDLYQMHLARDEQGTSETGLRWLDAALRCPNPQDLHTVIEQLLATCTLEHAGGIIEVVRGFLESQELTDNPDRSRAILFELRSVAVDSPPPMWNDLLARTAERLGVGEDSQAGEDPPAEKSTSETPPP